MTLPDDPTLRSFVEGVRALFLANTVSATDPLELFLDAIFGPRTDVSLPLPSAEEMSSAFAKAMSSMGSADDNASGYRERFPSFARDRYVELLRPAWSESSRAAAFSLLRRHVKDHDAWHYLSLRFGFGLGFTRTMTHEEIGRQTLRGKEVIDLAVGIAISTIRASSDADVLRQLSGRAG